MGLSVKNLEALSCDEMQSLFVCCRQSVFGDGLVSEPSLEIYDDGNQSA